MYTGKIFKVPKNDLQKNQRKTITVYIALQKNNIKIVRVLPPVPRTWVKLG